jgi:hypothetical protein
MLRLPVYLAICAAGLLGQTVNISLSGTATLSVPNFSIIGTGTISGLGNATLSGGGRVDSSGILGASTGPIISNIALVFPDGAILYGTLEVPSGVLIPQVGGTTTGLGRLSILGGIGRLEGARGTFTSLDGTVNASSTTSTTFTLTGTGTLGTGQKVLPQFVSGGGWYTALYFANSTATAVSFPIAVTGANGTPLAVAGFPNNVSIPTGGSVRLEARNVGELSQGYVAVTPPVGVTGYAVFRQSVAGLPDQEAVVPLSPVGARSTSLTFDDTNFVTAAAIVNPSTTSTIVTVTAKNAAGASLGSGTVTLNANAKTAVVLRNVPGLSAVAGSAGTATFTVTSGAVAVLGLRFNGPAFTSIPASN